MRKRYLSGIVVPLLGCALGAGLLAGCSSSGGSSDDGAGSTAATNTSASTAGGTLNDQLPADVKSAGQISIAISTTYQPMEFLNPGENTPVGFDVDLADAIGEQLGVKVKFSTQTFAQLINSINTGRDDMVLSGITDTKARQDTLDFIDYFKTGGQLYTTPANGDSLKVLTDLCGKTVAASKSTDYFTKLGDLSKTECTDAGKPAIKLLGMASSADARVQMQQGRADAVMQGVETIKYLLKQQPGTFSLIGDPINPSSYGIGFDKKNTALRDVVLQAVKNLFDDGTYGDLLAKWGLQDAKLDAPTVNAATN